MNSREKVQHAGYVAAKAGKLLPKGLVSAALWSELEKRSLVLTEALDARDAEERSLGHAKDARNEARAGLSVASRKAKGRLVSLEADGVLDLPRLGSGGVEDRLRRARALVQLAEGRVRLDELEVAIARTEAAQRAYLEAAASVAKAHDTVEVAARAWQAAYRALRSSVEGALHARGLGGDEVRRELRAVFGRRKASPPADPAAPGPDAAKPAV